MVVTGRTTAATKTHHILQLARMCTLIEQMVPESTTPSKEAHPLLQGSPFYSFLKHGNLWNP